MHVDAFDRGHLWRYRAKYVRCRDGDTVVVLIDNGFDSRAEVAVRLDGIDAVEIGDDGGFAARDALDWYMRLSATGLPARYRDWPLRVVTTQRVRTPDEDTSFDRYVGTVFALADNGDLADARDFMLSTGYARRV